MSLPAAYISIHGLATAIANNGTKYSIGKFQMTPDSDAFYTITGYPFDDRHYKSVKGAKRAIAKHLKSYGKTLDFFTIHYNA